MEGNEVGAVKILLLCVFLSGAGWTDLYEGKVRNTWILLGTLSGLWCCRGQFVGPAVLVLIPAFLLFRMGMMGAGDGKMMAVIAGFLGLDQGLKAIGLGMAAGAVWSLYRFWCSRNFSESFLNLGVYIRHMIQTGKMEAYRELSLTACGNTIPLAACLSGGTYLYLLGSCIWNMTGGIR